VEAFAKSLNRPCLLPTPDFVWRFIFGPERATMVTDGMKVAPRRTLETGFKFRYYI
jgi:NAD dependent epimerase/dehydratase family enzyme